VSLRLGSTAMTESTGMGARARLFLIAFAAIALAAIGHPSIGAGAIYPGEIASDDATLLEEQTVESEATAIEEPVAEPVPVETESAATEETVAEPVTETESAATEDPVAAPAPETESAADELAAEGLAADPEAAPAEPVLEGPPAEVAAAAVPGEEPAAEVTPAEEAVVEPTVDAPVEALPVALEAAVPEESELATPVAEPEESVVIQTASELESLPPISGELRAVLLADAPTSLTRIAEVSSAGTTTRTASGRPARGSDERPASEVGWPLQIPSPSAPPVPSRLGFTFNGQAPTGGSFRADLALAVSAFVFAFSLMARVARPARSRLFDAALVTRVPQPG
jgi:ribonuclease E